MTDIIDTEPTAEPELQSTVSDQRTLGQRVTANISRRPLLLALATALLILSGFLVFLTPKFGILDDARMVAIADGTAYGENLPHLVNTNVLVGIVLSTLYKAAPSIQWYGLWLYVLHFLSLTTILYITFSNERLRRPYMLVALGSILVIFISHMWIALTFTASAMMVGFLGVLLHTEKSPRPDTPMLLVRLGESPYPVV